MNSQKSSNVPKGWPLGVQYIPQPHAGDRLDLYCLRESISDLKAKHPDETPVKAPTGPVAHVKIQTITNPKHPAFNQHGLFAAKNLDPNTFVLLYCGAIHGREDTSEESNYDLSLDRENSIGIDAAKCGNEARFTNDYRGIRDVGPNAEFRDVWIDLGNGMAQRGIGIFVLSPGKGKGKDAGRSKGIRKGEEILVSYGKGFWTHRTQEEPEMADFEAPD